MKVIEIQNKKFVIQSFVEKEYFNLSAVDNGLPYNEKLGELKFNLLQEDAGKIILHTGKDTQFARDFISKINIQEVSNLVHNACLE